MNSFPKFGLVLILIVCSFALSCCKDKCKDMQPVKATFTMNQEIEGKLYLVENGDTIRKAENITFIADIEDTPDVSYEWKIGTDNQGFY